MRALWVGLGLAFVALGLLGVLLPILPTTPFLLLAAACFARSSGRLHRWLVEHRIFGPPIRAWREHRAISPRAKAAAVTAMAATLALSLVLGVPGRVVAVQAAVLLAVGGWILTRPSGP